ncbi:MAG TPA: NAD-binding protein, partial [Gammaproteobacteria bacterium]|nr:NAD-binding protein [Gammaproteobacteria bacterium]
LAVIVVSMLVSPLLIRINRVLAARIFPAGESDERDMLQHDVGQHSIQAEQHVLIVGYGRVGQNVARFLEQEDFPFVALDLDAMRVKRAREAGDPVYYGDGANPDILKAAGIGRARAVVISYFQVPTALKILRSVKELRPELPVLVRTRDDTDLDKLMAAGATEVIPETMEASLMVSAHLLHLLGMPMGRILRKVQEVRSHRYSLLRSVFRGQDALPISSGHAFREQLYTVTLDPGAHALGQTLDAINLKSVKVVVTALRREGVVGRQPAPNTVLKENDVLVLWGAPEDLETAESLLLGDIHTKPQPAKGPA